MAVEGIGVKIFHSSTATYTGTPTWTEVTDIVDVTPPNDGEFSDVDITTHAAVSDKRKRYQAGLIEPGDWSFKVHFAKAQHAALLALKGVTRGWRVIFSDGSKYESESYLKGDATETPMDGVVETEWTVKLAGDALFTPAT